MDAAADLEGTVRLIEVCPLKAADLAPPQAGGQFRVEEVVPDSILPDCLHELVQLLVCQHLLGLVGELGSFNLLGGIPRADAGLLGCSQCFMEHGVDAPDATAGQSLASVPVPAFRQCFIQPLDVFSLDLGDGLIPQIGFDVPVHCALVPGHGVGPDGPGDILQPAVQPLAQGHPALLGQVHPLVEIDVLAEFAGQFFLCVGVDIAEDGVAVFLVAHHDAALPAPVLSFPDHAVSGWSAFCHGLSPPFIHTQYSNSRRIATRFDHSYQIVINLPWMFLAGPFYCLGGAAFELRSGEKLVPFHKLW